MTVEQMIDEMEHDIDPKLDLTFGDLSEIWKMMYNTVDNQPIYLARAAYMLGLYRGQHPESAQRG